MKARCDPNTSDECLCGPFFDAVTYCTAQTCNAADNLGTSLDLPQVWAFADKGSLAALNFLSPAC